MTKRGKPMRKYRQLEIFDEMEICSDRRKPGDHQSPDRANGKAGAPSLIACRVVPSEDAGLGITLKATGRH